MEKHIQSGPAVTKNKPVKPLVRDRGEIINALRMLYLPAYELLSPEVTVLQDRENSSMQQQEAVIIKLLLWLKENIDSLPNLRTYLGTLTFATVELAELQKGQAGQLDKLLKEIPGLVAQAMRPESGDALTEIKELLKQGKQLEQLQKLAKDIKTFLSQQEQLKTLEELKEVYLQQEQKIKELKVQIEGLKQYLQNYDPATLTAELLKLTQQKNELWVEEEHLNQQKIELANFKHRQEELRQELACLAPEIARTHAVVETLARSLAEGHRQRQDLFSQVDRLRDELQALPAITTLQQQLAELVTAQQAVRAAQAQVQEAEQSHRLRAHLEQLKNEILQIRTGRTTDLSSREEDRWVEKLHRCGIGFEVSRTNFWRFLFVCLGEIEEHLRQLA